MSGLQIPGFDVIRSIPHEGVADLHLVKHPVYGEDVVCKRVDTLGREDSIAYLEPRLLHQMHHDNVAQILEARVTDENGGTKIVEVFMPFYPEGSVLDALMNGRRFSIAEAIVIARDVLSALSYLHEDLGYLHRDVKPANVLLEQDGSKARLTDFGSAAKLEHGTARGSLGRSPLYEPPEASAGPTSVAGDVYAAGLCLFETLSGRFPYEELSFDEVARRLSRGQRAIADRRLQHDPHVPSAVRRVVNAAIAQDPGRRYPSAAVFRAALTANRFVDWRRVAGVGLVGVWDGRWVGRAGELLYRVEARLLRMGTVRVTARRRSSAGERWMTVGTDQLVQQDALKPTLESCFEASLQDAAHRLPS
ncbi:MAG: serine/threonine-protein kinase [Actinomycetota bacterium]